MHRIKNFMLCVLLLANLTSEYLLLQSVSEVFFYSTLAISLLVIFFNLKEFGLSLKNAPEIIGLILVYLIAQFIFQSNILSTENILYTITKIVVFSIITISVYSNYDFYLNKAPIFFSFVIVVLILLGWFVNKTGQQYGALVFGFANRNVACTIATAGIAGFLFLHKKLNLIDFACMALLFVTILYGGSRNALAMCALIIAVRYGLSFKLIGVGALLLFLILYVFPSFGIEETAFDRVMGTLDGSVAIDREIERETAVKMIDMHPWTGWGYRYAIPKRLGISVNAHNGYLSMIVNLGYICGLAVLAIIAFGCLKRLGLFKYKNNAVNYYLAIMISTLFAANQEDYLIGVNQFTTNYFFVAFVVLGMYKAKCRNTLRAAA